MDTTRRSTPLFSAGGWIYVLAAVLAPPWLEPAVAAEDPQAVGGTGADEVRLWVEILDQKGRPPEGLGAGDLEIVDNGEALPLTAVRPAALDRLARSPRAARFVLYFDQALSSGGNLKRAAEALSGLAGRLAELGEVEIVMADGVPEQELRSRDPLTLTEKLSRTAITGVGRRRVQELRRRVLADLSTTVRSLGVESAAEVVTAGVEEELELVRERQKQLLTWATRAPATAGGAEQASSGSDGPRILILMMDGFDVDPVSFYLQYVGDDAVRAVLRRSVRLENLDSDARETARALAAAGWIVLPVAIGGGEADPGTEFDPVETDFDRGGVTTAPGIKIRPGSLFGRRRDREENQVPEPDLVDPRRPLEMLAAASGGEVVIADQGLRDAVERLSGRYEVAYRSNVPFDGSLRRVEVRARVPGLEVRGRRWLARGVPERVAAVRLERLLEGHSADGGLDVAAVVRLRGAAAGSTESIDAELESRLELLDVAALEAAVFRVTLGISGAGREPEVRSEILAGEDLRGLEEWRYQTSFGLSPEAAEVAILVEELTTGMWGGRRATVVEGDWAAGEALPAPTVVEILRPDQEVLRGRVKFETGVYDPRVARVDFLLDDREVASAARPPFSARLDLGRTPRRQTLTVIAYGADATALGRDSVVINAGTGGLDVAIVRPESRRGTGFVEVEAEVSVPLERRLDRVLFFWNNEPVATLYASPFRQRIRIPEEAPVGYVRVVALLDDGTVAEDVAFMNGPENAERLEVNLVELYVVVTDDRGRPVRGLTQQDFRVKEEGRIQEIATFSDAGDLPLTLGMAIDSSASMFVKLPRVQQAAIRFLESTWGEQDRAFVVDFDTEPRLARPTTSSLDRIVTSIGTLEPNGRTALWESIVFSLVQLQGVRGRKALVVFSDGADEDDQFPFRSSLSFAKKMGVPIYLILMKKRPEKESGLSLLARSFTSRANRLVEATGGRIFYAKEYRDLSQVYEEIEVELRSQYLLAYYPEGVNGSRAWRSVDVDVEGKGLRPRTLSGYWQ